MSIESTRAGKLIWEALEKSCTHYGARKALICASRTLKYAAFREQVQVAADLLRTWLPKEPRHIGFCLKNSVDYVVFYCGTLYIGGIPFLLDANFNSGELEAIYRDCSLNALLVERGRGQGLQLPQAGAPVAASPEVDFLRLEEPAECPFVPRGATEVCRFTSGTTGRPKCLEFSGNAVVAAAHNWIQGTGMKSDDRTLCLAALSNGLAFNTSLLPTFLAGAELHLHAGVPLTRQVAALISSHEITRLVAFPTLYRHFAAPGGPERAAMTSLQNAISAGAPLWSDVREDFRSRFGLDISDYYGIAETGPCTFELDLHYHSGLGKPLPGVELRIGEDGDEAKGGEILVRTASMASGYLNHPGLFEQRLDDEGFYHSGDSGKMIDGRLHLTGRTKDHINVAGRKIDPVEIVSVVLDLTKVRDAVAFPDTDFNRETVVHLVVVASTSEVTKNALMEACRSRLAAYKIPGRISFVEAIPRTGIGKPRIAVLRQQLAQSNT